MGGLKIFRIGKNGVLLKSSWTFLLKNTSVSSCFFPSVWHYRVVGNIQMRQKWCINVKVVLDIFVTKYFSVLLLFYCVWHNRVAGNVQITNEAVWHDNYEADGPNEVICNCQYLTVIICHHMSTQCCFACGHIYPCCTY